MSKLKIEKFKKSNDGFYVLRNDKKQLSVEYKYNRQGKLVKITKKSDIHIGNSWKELSDIQKYRRTYQYWEFAKDLSLTKAERDQNYRKFWEYIEANIIIGNVTIDNFNQKHSDLIKSEQIKPLRRLSATESFCRNFYPNFVLGFDPKNCWNNLSIDQIRLIELEQVTI